MRKDNKEHLLCPECEKPDILGNDKMLAGEIERFGMCYKCWEDLYFSCPNCSAKIHPGELIALDIVYGWWAFHGPDGGDGGDCWEIMGCPQCKVELPGQDHGHDCKTMSCTPQDNLTEGELENIREFDNWLKSQSI